MKESTLLTLILNTLGRTTTTRVFRNNVSLAWAANVVQKITRAMTVSVFPGDVVLRQARPIHTGLVRGAGDAIGWHSVTITPEMVGRRYAIFLNIEAKSETGRMRAEQVNFNAAVKAAGGLSGMARSVQDAERICQQITDLSTPTSSATSTYSPHAQPMSRPPR